MDNAYFQLGGGRGATLVEMLQQTPFVSQQSGHAMRARDIRACAYGKWAEARVWGYNMRAGRGPDGISLAPTHYNRTALEVTFTAAVVGFRA